MRLPFGRIIVPGGLIQAIVVVAEPGGGVDGDGDECSSELQELEERQERREVHVCLGPGGRVSVATQSEIANMSIRTYLQTRTKEIVKR